MLLGCVLVQNESSSLISTIVIAQQPAGNSDDDELLLLAAGDYGPLHPALPLARFVACAALPVRVVVREDSEKRPSSRSSSELSLLSSFAAKAALFAALVSLRRHRARLPAYAVPAFDGAHVYLLLELFMASAAALARTLLGAELELQFDRPYLAASLRDFWGRCWNLMVPAVLRPCVYRPVRARLGSAAAGVLAAFLVSGLMHEVMFYYITLELGTGEVTAFFALHGACAVAEGWWCAPGRQGGRRRWRPPRPVATALTLAFVTGTASWLFFAPVTRSGLDKAIVAECETAVAFLENLAAATMRLVSPATP
ncbi:hypothetical protein EJB05_37597, partial [Eragrostis curvula]